MNVVIRPDDASVTEAAYALVRDRLANRHCRVFGLPTGQTPRKLYSAMVAGYRRGELDFDTVQTFNLDEYLGLDAGHPGSFRHFMEVNLFAHVNIRSENIHFLDGLPEDIQAECHRYEWLIRECGGIDLQILGIGADGHIGFNEPTSSLASRTRDKTLTPRTILDNRGAFANEEEVPRWALTMGVGTILEAREILLLATGGSKAEAVAAMVEGPVTAMCTASVLQMHPRVTVILDEAAAARLQCDEYYRWMNENDPHLAAYLDARRQRYGRHTQPGNAS
ncbi:MAG: glucosamine-6-phosphate deaminase [Lentisphaeria bacterium]|nr:glucosamine-6-phosphate deaminase [Lentisphaeria bacterium]